MALNKLMKIRYLVIIVVLVVAVIAIIFLTKNKVNLPDSFTINIAGDYTSSGADGEYSASLTFENGFLISGWQKYSHGGRLDGGGFYCVFNPDKKSWIGTIKEYKLDESGGVISSNETSDVDCGSIENIGVYDIKTKEEMEEVIISSNLIEAAESSCPHSKTCYEILK